MTSALRALLHGILDYAGLFPPASLALDPAIRTYARYRQEADAWMLGRFVCPVARLDELAPFVDELVAAAPVPLAILGGKSKTWSDFDAVRADDLGHMARFRQRHGDRVALDGYEVPLPADLGDAAGGLPATRLHDIFLMQQTGHPFRDLVCETPALPDWRATTRAVLAALVSEGRLLGFKLRCGGTDASAFPSVEQVTFTLAACRDARIPLKFTAGLHHPIRHFNASVRTRMHGFVNVFVAGVLAHARNLSAEQLQPIVADEDAGHFVFDDTGLGWQDCQATVQEIVAARKQVLSFGSCSFDEPRDDLRQLGWFK